MSNKPLYIGCCMCGSYLTKYEPKEKYEEVETKTKICGNCNTEIKYDVINNGEELFISKYKPKINS